ncbi:cryptochrome DASH [Citrus sinensis]|uniref:cryptochrome DASH, chloroplastic/mitochondrial n=1 Tax=Citrus sinensis TaxID=2711 RepID=UPI0021932240|nr:cryptochrome DASH, chloroplastic/mitochondrial [Citrus sinensis]KAH9760048.1 cryptochrome DASH [Citrus sinensis]
MPMAVLRNSLASISAQIEPRFRFRTMNIIASKNRNPNQNIQQKVIPHCQVIPGADSREINHIVEETFGRYTSKALKRNGKGVAIVWFRNDLRVLDNEALLKAWDSSEMVLPVYCVDPRHSQTTYHFGFPKTGALRAQFLIECLADLRKNLMNRGLNLLIRHGKPEEIIPSLAKSFGAHAVYAQKETCSEELNVERLVRKNLQQVVLSSQSNDKSTNHPQLKLIWGTTMYHLDDIPFDHSSLPDVYTQFRKSIEAKCTVRGCIRIPSSFGPPPSVVDWGSVPLIEQLELHSPKVSKGMRFVGGESAALGRVNEYFWKKDLLKVYKETRNEMLGPDYSTKFSPWLASGSISPRYIYEEVKSYERERVANDSTYWVLFELMWRDYFRFISLKYGNSLFHLGGPRKLEYKWSQDQKLFESWRDGCTGYPLIDANMKELSMTGFMSNRGRQIACSFLVRDMGIDWRMGAEWFETCLLDYDPCSNYGNWTYGAGVGNDPREDRYFSIPKQAQNYDREGEYVAYWLPQLKALPKERRNFPGGSYIEQIVSLKHGNINQNRNQNDSLTRTGRRNNFKGKHAQVNR